MLLFTTLQGAGKAWPSGGLRQVDTWGHRRNGWQSGFTGQ